MDIWRLILDTAGDAYWNMAVDEALFQSHCSGQTPSILRFYAWTAPSVSLGRFQKVHGSIDTDFCSSKGIAIVRRPTGGRAVMHGTDLTFSIVNSNDGGSVQDSYQQLTTAILQGLISAGVPVQPFEDSSGRESVRRVSNCFDLRASFEVALEGRKVLGSAQLRAARGVLQQNSLVLQWPTADNLNAFVDGRPMACGPCVADYADRDTLVGCVSKAFEHCFGLPLDVSELSDAELLVARRLAENKYQTDAWNLRGCAAFVDTELSSVIY